MQLSKAMSECQTDAESAGTATRGVITTAKHLEQARQGMFADTDSVIGYGDLACLSVCACANLDATLGIGVLGCIVHQVGYDLRQAYRIALNPQRCIW